VANRSENVNKAVLLVGSALIAVSVFLPMIQVTRSPPALLDPSLYPHGVPIQEGGINTAMFLTMGSVFAVLPFIMLAVCAWGAISTMAGAPGKLSSATLRVGLLAVVVEAVAYVNMRQYDGKVGGPTNWMDQTGMPASGAYLAFGASLVLIGWALFLRSSSRRQPSGQEGLLSATYSGAAAAPADRPPAYGTPRYGSQPPATATTGMPLLPALPALPVMPAPPPFLATPAPPVAVATQSPPGWYPDSFDPTIQRYFDGTNWTANTAPR